jgi:two-component system CheB/CheR fusion protein
LQLLVVEDDLDTRDLMDLLLRSYGAQVTCVTGAADAFIKITQSVFDVLVDIAMPKEDGYSLLRQVRAWETQQGGFVPAVALTGYARDSDGQAALDAGFQVHVAKPYDLARLIAIIAQLALVMKPAP